MRALGIDIGTSTVKLALVSGDDINRVWSARHYGRIKEALLDGLSEMAVTEEPVAVCVTGSGSARLPGLPVLGDIPAIVEGVKRLVPEVGCIVEIGSQGSRFVTNLRQGAPEFAVNEHCAGGTGSFFEDQMNRLGMRITDFSETVDKACSIPRLSGRCAVFAKTDITHRQAEGVSTPDILNGLCYAMVRNYKATIVRALPVEKPVVFAGGVTANTGVVRALRDVFELKDEELIVPELALYAGAIGAAVSAEPSSARTFAELTAYVETCEETVAGTKPLVPLVLTEGTVLADPPATGVIPGDGVVLGIDIGSTSTNLVMTDREGNLVDFQYLRTSGNPERAVRTGLANIRKKYGEVDFLGVGVTGSGRTRIGQMLGADTVRDEITAQAKAAARVDPLVDTVFEIGGQDSKYISLKDGEVRDFMMNKICAAGTGSFVEEQAARMDIALSDFGPMALSAKAPADLGERCTVFIETAISSAEAEGTGKDDIAAGLCHSIVKNYLHKVVGNKPVGDHIVLQGGVNYNPGIVAAFQSAYGNKVHVSPCFSISGAYGVCLLTLEQADLGHSTFKGFDFDESLIGDAELPEHVKENIAFYEKSEAFLTRGYTGELDPDKKTVGIPYALLIHRLFPMVFTYFTKLGYNVLLSDPTNEETIAAAQACAVGETCYPVKLIYGHMKQLIDKGVDYLFLPSVRTMKHVNAYQSHPYGCVYMQTAAISIAKNLGVEEKGIQLLSPVLDLDMGMPTMGKTFIGMGVMLGHLPPFVMKALLAGANAMREYIATMEQWGEELLSNIRPDEKVLVLVTRPYGINDPVLNMQVPRLLLERGYKVITNTHIPGHDVDLSKDYPGMFWPFGEHILSSAKLIKHHPNLYMVYLTNHGCGPDAMLSHLVAKEMGDKPYLQIEVDEHFSKVGVITRVEAFLNSLESRAPAELPDGFEIRDVDLTPAYIAPSVDALFGDARKLDGALGAIRAEDTGAKAMLGKLPPVKLVKTLPNRILTGGTQDHHKTKPAISRPVSVAASSSDTTLFVPPLGEYTEPLLRYFKASCGVNAFSMPAPDAEVLALGRKETTTKEYLTYTATAGMALAAAASLSEDHGGTAFLVPATSGSEADGVYHQLVRDLLDARGYSDVGMASPVLETLPQTLPPERLSALFHAILAGDLLYAAPADERETLRERFLGAPLTDTALQSAADNIGSHPAAGRRLAAVGTPMSLTTLDSGVLETLEAEGETILRQPLSEYLWFLWTDAPDNEQWDEEPFRLLMTDLHARLGTRSPFSAEPERLATLADRTLRYFAGANGRYRLAKTIEASRAADAVLTCTPRYENTDTILDMRGLQDSCTSPLFRMQFDNDWDEAAWARLRSFLFYIKSA